MGLPPELQTVLTGLAVAVAKTLYDQFSGRAREAAETRAELRAKVSELRAENAALQARCEGAEAGRRAAEEREHEGRRQVRALEWALEDCRRALSRQRGAP